MKREETVKILMMIQAAYPNYKPQDKTIAINTWNEMLSEYTYQQVAMALKAFITTDTSGFAPSIGQLIQKIQEISCPYELNEMEAWALVSKALRHGSEAAEEFAKLPPIIQKTIGGPEQLRNWAYTDLESVENVIQSNFMRTYRTVLAREKEVAKMPVEIRNLINRNMVTQIEEMKPQQIETAKQERPAGIPMPERLKEQYPDLFRERG